MPEGLEAEIYRRAAHAVVGRRIGRVEIDDRQPMAVEIPPALVGRSIAATRRTGKVVFLDLADGSPGTIGHARVLSLHFGMTGRLVVDGAAPIADLAYSSRRDDPGWDRLSVRFLDGGVLRVNDPRRWARFTLDPDESRLGPDFLSVGAHHLAAGFERRRVAVKTALLDQSLVAGFGNMCVDEILWQAGIAPTVPARELARDRVDDLVTQARRHLPAMLERGGSHCGTIEPDVRATLPPCPRDGAPMRRDAVGGRTTIWCPTHQAVA